MLITIPDVLPREAALALGQAISLADWIDGNVTSGEGAALAKHNRQLSENGEQAIKARQIVQKALARNAIFLSAALPYAIYPPLFNRYDVSDGFGHHVDNAIRVDPLSGSQMRTDLSATLFLNDPDDYDGGELTIEGAFGRASYKLPAGHLLLYPSSSIHNVKTVTRGVRICSFFWIESLVRENEPRETLFDLDQSIQHLTVDRGGDDAEVLRLTQIYHNLVRRWAKR
ncbi:MAG: Fe2+-dependent dioxygenase [Sphingorhabdus sp.]